ncbi:tetratricopeptide repeat protein [Sorangium sp. So ce128]|uniref:serine/threonine-protein kinase n=1 Tax=Sorangium sp. So ce128 TaxID=3133281 RepID=UPI003F62D17C
MSLGESVIICPGCSAENSPFNPRCTRCEALLSEEPRSRSTTADEPPSRQSTSRDEHVSSSVTIDPLASTVVVPDGGAPVPPAPPGAEASLDLRPGTKLGRFEVLDRLGEGGMGVVVRARDHVLGRDVAIKVLRPEVLGRSGAATALARLVREAQAMARIKHPNVVTVHEVDASAGQVRVVMEHVDGRTLRAFCAEKRRPASEVVAAFLQAGKGLSQVHHAGLVHRDFKPDNVLVGADGRVRVTDFGLAGLAEGEAGGGGAEAGIEAALTRSGSFLGTPVYMAPEQHRREAADARADQYAFCVSLWEALAGERPFAGKTYDELRENVALGRVREPPRGAEMPARIRRCIERGLSVDRDARYPDMDALLDDLSNDPAAAWRRGLVAASGLALAGLLAFAFARQPADRLCKGGEARLAGVWDEATMAKVRAAFAGTGRPHAEDTYRRVEKALGDRARAWVAMYADSCEATHVRGDQSAGLLDLRTLCLERRRQEMGALTALFAHGADAEVLDRSIEASLALPGLERCADAGALTAAIPPPADAAARARIDALRRRLAEVRALDEAGKFGDALALARPLADEARAADYAPIEAEALLMLGRAARDAHDAPAAEAALREALRAAARARDDALAAEAWPQLIYVVGYLGGRHADALALQLAAEGAVERTGGDTLASARLLGTLGSVLDEQGKYDEAAQHVERALAGLEKALGPSHPEVGATWSRLGTVLLHLERFDDAERAYTRALAVREETLGASHPSVALTLNSLGRLFNTQGKYRDALPRIERAIAIQERALGPDHPFLGASVNNLGNALVMLGETDAARRAHERVLAIREKALGPDHPDVASSLNNIGAVLEMQQKFAEATPYYERSLAIREKALGPDHANVAASLGNLGSALVAQKRYAEGLVRLERAAAIQEKALGPSSHAVASMLTGIASAYNEKGEPGKARPFAERALAIYAAKGEGVSPIELADTRFHAARALWGSARDRKRAVELATQARDAYAAEEGEYAKRALTAVNGWLAAHGGAR